MELRRCARMSALISGEQCDRNQKRGMFSCDSCPGLADVVEIDLEEVVDMSAQRCKVEGCEKQAQKDKDGMCHAHWREVTGTPRKPWGSNRKEKASDRLTVEVVDGGVVAPEIVKQTEEATLLAAFLAPLVSEAAPVRGLAGLLATTGLTMNIPWELADRMAVADVSVDDVVELVGLLLDGKLRKA